jgi:hypothetical protein
VTDAGLLGNLRHSVVAEHFADVISGDGHVLAGADPGSRLLPPKHGKRDRQQRRQQASVQTAS